MIFDKLFKKEESNDKSTETNHVHTIDYYAEGKSQFEAGNYTLAMEYFQAAIEENPKNERDHLLLGKAYFNANKEELAKKTFFTLLSINPNHNEALAEIQKLSFSSNTSRKSINLVDINADEDDPIIGVVPPDENGTYYWMTEQLSGNKLFFLDYSFVS